MILNIIMNTENRYRKWTNVTIILRIWINISLMKLIIQKVDHLIFIYILLLYWYPSVQKLKGKNLHWSGTG